MSSPSKNPLRYWLLGITGTAYVISVVFVFQLIDQSPAYLTLLIASVLFYAVTIFAIWARYYMGYWPNLRLQILLSTVNQAIFLAMVLTIVIQCTNFSEYFSGLPGTKQASLVLFLVLYLAYCAAFLYGAIYSPNKPKIDKVDYTQLSHTDGEEEKEAFKGLHPKLYDLNQSTDNSIQPTEYNEKRLQVYEQDPTREIPMSDNVSFQYPNLITAPPFIDETAPLNTSWETDPLYNRK